MSTFVSALMQLSLLSTSVNTYDQAYKMTNETGRPLVVLVGADWCPGCQTMKRSVIPQLESRGSLKSVAFATVNSDQQQKLAGRLMQGSSIPQLIMFVKTDAGWQRKQIVGARSVPEIEAFLAQSRSTPKPTVEQPVDRLAKAQ
ncbi:MAG: thioredoxin family protein [Pirellulales bacterium]